MLSGSDLLATAQTGTGKTAGFVLPILDRLAIAPKEKGARRRIRALILTPTRELAAQVEQNIRSLGIYAGFVSTTIYGGMSMRAQIQMLQKGVDVLVATPGRLLDHVQQKTIDLGGVEIFVLDEADRMLDMGFAPDVRRIANLLSPERQTAMFSATFSAQTRALANATLRSPQLVEVGRTDRPVDLVTQQIYLTTPEQKSGLLRHLITHEKLEQVLVFTKTKHGADRLAIALERAGISADAIHGDKRQAQRQKALARFKQGSMQVLVATDVAARGIDISGLPSVINYDAPNTPEAYVHRIGRTGRAGTKGRAISLVTPAERGAFVAVERHMQCKIERKTAEGFVAHAPDMKERSAVGGRPADSEERSSRPASRPAHRGEAGERGKPAARRGREQARPGARTERPAREAPHLAAVATTRRHKPESQDTEALAKGPGGRGVRARHSENAEFRGERSPKRRVGNVFRGTEGSGAERSRAPVAAEGGKRQGFIQAIARFLGD